MRRRTSTRFDAAAVDVVAVVEDLALEPEAGIESFMRLRLRMKVDLPQPDGPITAVTRLR